MDASNVCGVVSLCLCARQADVHVVSVLMHVHDACYSIGLFHSLIDVGLLWRRVIGSRLDSHVSA